MKEWSTYEKQDFWYTDGGNLPMDSLLIHLYRMTDQQKVKISLIVRINLGERE